jgi:ABC-2 type transport system ATP-binding protein/lipopolysaccharide transport system ATP-binding protein
MRVRLAFAVSTSIEPEILLLDEGLGTGDVSFLEKARARVAEFTNRAAIIVLAAHSERLVRKMCDKAVLLEHGRLLMAGPIDEIFAEYNARYGPHK